MLLSQKKAVHTGEGATCFLVGSCLCWVWPFRQQHSAVLAMGAAFHELFPLPGGVCGCLSPAPGEQRFILPVLLGCVALTLLKFSVAALVAFFFFTPWSAVPVHLGEQRGISGSV